MKTLFSIIGLMLISIMVSGCTPETITEYIEVPGPTEYIEVPGPTEYIEVPCGGFSYFKSKHSIAGYDIYVPDYGMCEAWIEIPIYENDEYILFLGHQFGCAPDWINSQSLFIHINESLYSVDEALRVGHITPADLEKHPSVTREDK